MRPPRSSRRRFLAGLAGSAAAVAWPSHGAGAPSRARRFTDLRRHFLFDYFPWYGGPPDYMHWDFWGRRPPEDLASQYVPRLGAYDVRTTSVLEQHARWIADSGAGGVALSWWGPGSWEDAAVHRLMDVFRDHDLKVTFSFEPYRDDRGAVFARDVLHVVREYGERRRYDALLLLGDADGNQGPVFKGFRCILPAEATDCEGNTHPVSDFTADDVWRRQTDAVRDALRGEFHHVTLLADSLEFRRTPASGFDGISIYDNFIGPEQYAGYARGASETGLVFAFNVNPGFDSIEPRPVPRDPCYAPQAFAPGGEAPDFTTAAGRERAAAASAARIAASFRATLDVQSDPALANARKGFLLVFMNSFNEWHEGHAFEPMKDARDLTPAERRLGYHNPERGGYRLAALGEMIRKTLSEGPPTGPREPVPAVRPNGRPGSRSAAALPS